MKLSPRLLRCLALAPIGLAGCVTKPVKPEVIPSAHSTLPAKDVPEFLSGSILAIADLTETGYRTVSGFGLVTGLDDTGDGTAPNQVREYMISQMTKHRFGSPNQQGVEKVQPTDVLRDKRATIVKVDAFIPPGARKGQRVDLMVSALTNNQTSSLARGNLYRCDLKAGGANARQPNDASINPDASGEGPILVNPAYMLGGGDPADPAVKRSLRSGLILGGGTVKTARPLALRVRAPSYQTARAIERRIDLFCQDSAAAAARDDGVVLVNVPDKYGGDWQHFSGVIMHLFMVADDGFAAIKAKRLAEMAVKPDAYLEDIALCWEALGPASLPAIQPLISHESVDVRFAAASAAARLGDQSAIAALQTMAMTPKHKFALNSVETLAALTPRRPMVSVMLRDMLDGDDPLLRIAAYEGLRAERDGNIITTMLGEPGSGFAIEQVRSEGVPMIYATRQGSPRIVLFGVPSTIVTPVFFATFNDRLTINAHREKEPIAVSYRPISPGREPVQIKTLPDLFAFVRTLGDPRRDGAGLRFAYADIVAVLQRLNAANLIVSSQNAQATARFVLQDAAFTIDPVDNASPIDENERPTRPQSDGSTASAQK